MEDTLIIKALECCSCEHLPCGSECPGWKVGCEIEKYALDLINRQKAEIERLQNTIDDVLDRQPLLVERAEKYAIKEFAERLCEGRVSNDPVVIAVKVELEEMTQRKDEGEMNKKHIAHSDDSGFEKKVKKLLLFRKIVEVKTQDSQTGVLTLDNGTELIVEGNEGCGGCENGWFYLDELNGCDNAITNVECISEQGEYDDFVYHIFVFAEDKKIHCLQYSGCDNGYYGIGYDLYVTVNPTEKGGVTDTNVGGKSKGGVEG